MTKKEKTEKCREILYKYNIGQNLSDDDFEFMISIFEGHSEWDIKMGCGVSSVSVMKTQFGKCFQINRIDGTSTDISFTHSITNRSKDVKIKLACRSAIRDIVVKYKSDNVVFGETICPITGEVLVKENTHIDHYDLTFDAMFNLWIKKLDADYVYSMINETTDNNMVTYFTDDKLNSDFVEFHNQYCKLRAVSQKANLSVLKKLQIDEIENLLK
jgi:hypothetical protein